MALGGRFRINYLRLVWACYQVEEACCIVWTKEPLAGFCSDREFFVWAFCITVWRDFIVEETGSLIFDFFSRISIGLCNKIEDAWNTFMFSCILVDVGIE